MFSNLTCQRVSADGLLLSSRSKITPEGVPITSHLIGFLSLPTDRGPTARLSCTLIALDRRRILKSPTLHRCPVSLDCISVVIIIIIIFPIPTPPRTFRQRTAPLEHLGGGGGVSIEMSIFDSVGCPTSWFAPRQFDIWTRPFGVKLGGFPQKSLSFNMAHLEVVETGIHTTNNYIFTQII